MNRKTNAEAAPAQAGSTPARPGARPVKRYAVFGAGWGGEYLSTGGNHPGSGRIAYSGPSLARARRVLARMHREVEKLRQRLGMRNAADTYAIYDDAGQYGWRISPEIEGGAL